jgi:hypothetical protein
MLSHVLPTALLSLTLQAAPVPTTTLGPLMDPTISMALAMSSGTPFQMADSIPTPTLLMARSFDWTPSVAALVATVPAVISSPSARAPSPVPSKSPAVTTIVVAPTASSSTVLVPAPTPSYTWAETHDDSKNTHKNILVAVIVGSILAGAALVSFAVYCVHRCIHGKPGMDDSMKRAIEDVEANRQPGASDASAARWVHQAPMELTDFSTLTAGNRPHLTAPAPPSRVHWSRGQGMRPVWVHTSRARDWK